MALVDGMACWPSWQLIYFNASLAPCLYQRSSPREGKSTETRRGNKNQANKKFLNVLRNHDFIEYRILLPRLLNTANDIWLLLLSHFSRVRLCETPWTVVQQVPLATGFSRQEYWHGMPFLSPQKHQINTEKHIDLLTSSLCDNVKSSNKKKSTLNIFFACSVIIFKHILVNGSYSESKI